MRDKAFPLKRHQVHKKTLKKVDHFLNIIHNLMTHDHKILTNSVRRLHK